jgi:hypothetical protein
MESNIHGFFDSLDSTASPFTHLHTQDRERISSTVALHRFNQVFEEKLSRTWIPNTNSGLLNPQAEKLGFAERNRVIAR